MTDSESDLSRELYIDCISKQLEEVNLLSSIYSAPGELQMIGAGVISDFNDFLNAPTATPLHAHLDFVVQLTVMVGNVPHKIDARFELPHLYPRLQHPLVVVLSPLLNTAMTENLRAKVEEFIATLDKTETYVFQVITWLQETIEKMLETNGTVQSSCNTDDADMIDFERLWIFSHHIKSKSKRQEILRQARLLQLSGFSRPGKPGIICVEGLCENTQEFWRVIKAMHWHKIAVCKSETARKRRVALPSTRRFEGFKEQLFCDDPESETNVMDMAAFIVFLKAHNSGYMTQPLFGFD